jgi:hypothetical protein
MNGERDVRCSCDGATSVSPADAHFLGAMQSTFKLNTGHSVCCYLEHLVSIACYQPTTDSWLLASWLAQRLMYVETCSIWCCIPAHGIIYPHENRLPASNCSQFAHGSGSLSFVACHQYGWTCGRMGLLLTVIHAVKVIWQLYFCIELSTDYGKLVYCIDTEN